MRVGVAQIDCVVGDLEANTKTAVKYIFMAASRGCDVVVLPEMCDTGYVMAVIVEKGSSWETGPVVELREAASRAGVHVIAGLSERHDDRVFNAVASIDSEGRVCAKYRKTHLITAAPIFEHHFLAAGDELVVSDVSCACAGFMTCYDVRFPEVARCLALAGAEVIFLVSAFPLVRLSHWKTLIEARAIENQVFLVASNRTGTDGPGLTFCGASRVLDPYGTIITSASEIDETLLVADIDLARVEEIRLSMRLLEDRRPDLYGCDVAGRA